MSLLRVHGLTVGYHGASARALSDIDFAMEAGEIVGVSGPSGCGKTTLTRALLGLLPRHTEIAGSIQFGGRELTRLNEPSWQQVRGAQIAVVFQEPGLALHPLMRAGDQIAEVVRAHVSCSRRAAWDRARAALDDVGLGSDADRIARSYPHQLSGGQQQRVLLAQAIVCRPALVVADEPTASLDRMARDGILALIRDLNRQHGTAFLVISHSSAVLNALTPRVLRIEQGTIAHTSPTVSICPSPDSLRASPASVPVVDARQLMRTYRAKQQWLRRSVDITAVDAATLAIHPKTTVGLAGPSGSGKSTLARCLALVERPDAGAVRIDGREVTGWSRRALAPIRNRVQLVFQDSAAALSPRLTAAEIVAEPLVIQGVGTPRERERITLELLDRVGLPAARARDRAAAFSGGERQRLALARALAVNPGAIVFDESLSGIDRAQRDRILALLFALQRERGLAYLFISHDEELLADIASETWLMEQGRLIGPASPMRLAAV